MLINAEMKIENGCAVYHLARCEHRECRIFIKQTDGKVYAAERAPVNGYYRRRIDVFGLKDATVFVYPETYCIESARVADANLSPDSTPQYIDGFKTDYDKYGKYLKAEHISGNIALYMPRKK